MGIYDASGNFLSTLPLGAPLPNTGTGERLIEGISFNYQAVLKTPEPASLAVLGIGLVGLAAVRRRKTT